MLADATAGPAHEEYAPAAFGNVPRQKAAAHLVREIDGRPRHDLARSPGAALREDADQGFVAIEALADEERRIRRRPHDIDMTLHYALARQFRVALDRAAGEARGEVAVVENPDLHAEAFAFGEDGVHVAPPARAAEVGVRARLHAQRAAAGRADARDLLRNLRGVVAVLPVERKEVVFLPPGKDVKKSGIGHFPAVVRWTTPT